MRARLGAGIAGLVLLTACGGAGSTAAFTAGPDQGKCLVHQKKSPTKAYEGGTGGVTGLELPFLAYLTAHGSQPFCDAKAATSHDLAWGQLYVRLTENAERVRTLLAT